MPITSEIRVALDDKPGTLARIATTLGKAGINISGFSVTSGCGRFFVEDAPKALNALKGAGMAAWAATVVTFDLEDKAGTFAPIARALAERGVNVDAGYTATAKKAGRVTAILDVSDVDAAMEVAKSL